MFTSDFKILTSTCDIITDYVLRVIDLVPPTTHRPNPCDNLYILYKQGVSPSMICSFNLIQGKKGKELVYKAKGDESQHLL